MIESVSVVAKDIPFSASFPTSYEDHGPSRHVFVKLETETHVGYGEGTALQWFTGETTGSMERIVRDHFAPLLHETIDDALRTFREYAARLPGHPGAKASVEMALLDLAAKQADVPLHRLLGVRYRDEIPIAFASGALPAETVAENVADAFENGYRTFKIKADGDPDGDVARVNAVTRTLAELADPADVNVRVDANTGWQSFERATSIIERIERKRYVEYFEQPVATAAEDDLRALRRRTGVPVFADEAVGDLGDVRRLSARPAAISGFCAKLAKTGSLLDVVTMGEFARSADLPVTLVSAFESSLGVAADLHVASVLPSLSSAAELGSDLIAADPVRSQVARDPTTPIPDGPGIGVELDDALFT